jgi:hypothetical protein
MFALMKDLSRRGVEVVVGEEIRKALAALDIAIDAIKGRVEGDDDDAAADEEMELKVKRFEWAVENIESEIRCHRVFVQYGIAFPAWTIIDLRPRAKEDFLKMQAAVESCVTLTDEEKAAWKEEYDYRFAKERLTGGPEDWPGLTSLVEENPDLQSSDEQGGN